MTYEKGSSTNSSASTDSRHGYAALESYHPLDQHSLYFGWKELYALRLERVAYCLESTRGAGIIFCGFFLGKLTCFIYYSLPLRLVNLDFFNHSYLPENFSKKFKWRWFTKVCPIRPIS